MKVLNQSVKLEFITPNALKFIERMARVSRKSEDSIIEENTNYFVRGLICRNEEPVLEHAHATFRVICDRGVSHEFVRHRIFSYTQESTRYCNYSKNKFGNEISIIKTPLKNVESFKIWEDANKASEKAYFKLLKLGEKPEIARSVLMTDLKTELVGTANFREWRHFLYLRTDKKAHPQMREIADLILNILYHECSPVFDDLVKIST